MRAVYPIDLSPFTRLVSIRLDHSNLELTYEMRGVTHTIQEVDIRGTFWPSPMFYEDIRIMFRHVRVLRLTQESVWCGLCNLCVKPSFQGEGVGSIIYEGGMGLPVGRDLFLDTNNVF